MARIDLQKLALRLKVVEMLKIHALRRQLAEAAALWRRLVHPN
ncbi:hypothetical protein ACFL6X_07420 [Candidatus Latescibacterota bacterium]